MNRPHAPLAGTLRVLLLKASKIAHQAGFYLQGGRWHKVSPDKPAPAGHPVLAQKPESGHTRITGEMWQQLHDQHPANSNKATYSKKLDKLKEAYHAGDTHAILGASYPNDTTHKKVAHVANFVLANLGSEHQVHAGLKQGTHPALSQAPAAPAPAPTNTESSPATPALAPAAAAPKAGNSSSALTHTHWQSIKDAHPDNSNKKAFVSKVEKIQQAHSAGDAHAILGMSYPNDTTGKKVVHVANAALADLGSDHKVHAGLKQDSHDALGQKPAETPAVTPAVPGPKDGDTKQGAEGELVFKDGHWHKQEERSTQAAGAESATTADVTSAPAEKPAETPPVTGGADIEKPKEIVAPTAGEVDALKADLKALGIGVRVLKSSGGLIDVRPKLPPGDALPLFTKDQLAQVAQVLDKHGMTYELCAWAGKTMTSYFAGQEKSALNLVGMALNHDGSRGTKPLPMATAAEKPAETTSDASAVTGLAMPEFVEGAKTTGVVAHYQKVAQKVLDLASAGDAAGLAQLKADGLAPKTDGKVGNTWKGKTANSKILLALHDAATAQMAGTAPAAAPVQQAPAEQPQPAPVADAGALPLPPTLADAGAQKLADAWHALAQKGGFVGVSMSVAHASTSPMVADHDDGVALLEYGKELIDAMKAAGAGPEAGPQEGDTKMGAEGMLVLKDGHWVKMNPDAPAGEPVHPLDAIPVPSLDSFHNPAKVAAALEELKAKIKAEGPAALKGVTKKMSATGKLITKVGGYKITGHVSSDSSHSAVYHYVEALKTVAGSPKKTKAAAASTAAAGPAPYAPPEPASESIDGWKQIGPQGGSNPGGKFVDDQGVEWYCKFPGDPDVAKSEVLAAKLYEAAGITGQDCKLITKDGKLGIASKWVDVQKAGPDGLAKAEGVAEGFAVDAWLANWDVVGLAFDNLQLDAHGQAVRVDAGGSLEYRAQGGKKAFGESVSEIDTLRDPKINPQSAQVFGHLTAADITASVAKVAEVPDDAIYDLVMEFGPGSMADKAHLIDTLIARKQDLLAKYPKAAKKSQKAKVKPEKQDPTALKVDPSQLPQPHDFHNWNGPGNGLSSKTHVNDMNLKAEQDLLDFAAKGNLIALKDYHYEAVDKDTGAPTGQQHIEQHPSQHVKTYWSDLVSTLGYIANPPEQLKRFKSVVAAGLKKVSDAFASAGYGTTTSKVAANQRLAFWIALGHTKPVEALVPNHASLEFQSTPVGVPKMTEQMKAAAKQAYASLASDRLVKRFINGIQASGTYNDNFRDGKMVTHDGKDAVGMVLDAYSYATEKPEGFEVYKWVSFPGDMGKQMLNAKPGTVFQNPGSMCCSYNPTATSGFGPDRMRIRFAKGSKAVDSFGSGSFSSEQEITTLPGQRFVILSSKKVHCPVKHKERIELDVLMLPPDDTYVAELEANKGKHGQSS